MVLLRGTAVWEAQAVGGRRRWYPLEESVCASRESRADAVKRGVGRDDLVLGLGAVGPDVTFAILAEPRCYGLVETGFARCSDLLACAVACYRGRLRLELIFGAVS